jgi:hypothetical protein
LAAGPAKFLRHRRRFGDQAAVGEADDPLARGGQLGVAAAIALELAAGPVEPPGIDLDDQARARGQ